MKDIFVELTRMRALQNRETCPHWIDYEIYDYLPEQLAEKYLEQFDFPTICWSKGQGEEDFSKKVLCKPNDKDDITKGTIDCSCHYPQTLDNLFRDFGKIDIE